MNEVALFNGINSYGEGNVDRLNDPLEAVGFTTYDITIPKRRVWNSNRWTTRRDADLAFDQFEGRNPKIAVAHSRGCLVAMEIAKLWEFDLILLSRPAMGRNYKVDGIKGSPLLICLYSKQDIAVWAGSWLPLHVFGRAGTKGVKTPGFFNVRMKGGHNADFEPPQFNEVFRLVISPGNTLRNLGDRVTRS